MKNKKFNRILDFVFWFIIAFITFVKLYNGGLTNITISDIQNIDFSSISLSQYVTIVLTIFFAVSISVILSMFNVFYLTIIYFGIKISSKKYNKERIEKVDISNDNYYRDILPQYSASVLSYLDDFKINKEDIVATLLMLELKNKIKLKNDGIVLLDDTNDNLEENEIYILKCIREKTLKNINLYNYANVVKNDALKKGLIQEKSGVRKKIKRKIITNTIIFLVALIGFFMIPNWFTMVNNNILLIFSFILLIVFFAILTFIPYYTIVYISHYKLLNTLDPYVRNDEGRMINTKLEGLRKYLIDFSKIEDKTKEQLILWEEYLVYSVLLGINTKVIEEVYNKI